MCTFNTVHMCYCSSILYTPQIMHKIWTFFLNSNVFFQHCRDDLHAHPRAHVTLQDRDHPYLKEIDTWRSSAVVAKLKWGGVRFGNSSASVVVKLKPCITPLYHANLTPYTWGPMSSPLWPHTSLPTSYYLSQPSHLKMLEKTGILFMPQKVIYK